MDIVKSAMFDSRTCHIFVGAPTNLDDTFAENATKHSEWTTHVFRLPDLRASENVPVTDSQVMSPETLQLEYNYEQSASDCAGARFGQQNHESRYAGQLFADPFGNPSPHDDLSRLRCELQKNVVQGQLLSPGHGRCAFQGPSSQDERQRQQIEIHVSKESGRIVDLTVAQESNAEASVERKRVTSAAAKASARRDHGLPPLIHPYFRAQQADQGDESVLIGYVSKGCGDEVASQCDGTQMPDVSPAAVVPISKMMCTKSYANIFVVVLQVDVGRSVQVRQGPRKGAFATLASCLVGDQSRFSFAVKLWDHAALWVEKLHVGDFVLMTQLRAREWMGAAVGATSATSKIYNFHQPVKPYPDCWSSLISLTKLEEFVTWCRVTHPDLFLSCARLPVSKSGTAGASGVEELCETSSQLSPGALYTLAARVLAVRVCSDTKLLKFASGGLPKVAVSLQSASDLRMELYLSGAQCSYLADFRRHIGWEVLVTSAVVQSVDSSSGCPAFRTTPKSSITFSRTTSGGPGVYKKPSSLLTSDATRRASSECGVAVISINPSESVGAVGPDVLEVLGCVSAIFFTWPSGEKLALSSADWSAANEKRRRGLFERCRELAVIVCRSCHRDIALDANGVRTLCGVCDVKLGMSRSDTAMLMRAFEIEVMEELSQKAFHLTVLSEDSGAFFAKYLLAIGDTCTARVDDETQTLFLECLQNLMGTKKFRIEKRDSAEDSSCVSGLDTYFLKNSPGLNG